MMWACGWSDKSKRCLRYHCRNDGPCKGYLGDPGMDRAVAGLGITKEQIEAAIKHLDESTLMGPPSDFNEL